MSTTFLLTGIDGANPLGYLAALGVLRTLPGSKLRWELIDSVWRPELRVVEDWNDGQLCESLLASVRTPPPAIELLGKNLTVPPIQFAAYMEAAERGSAEAAAFAAAFGIEVCRQEGKDRIEYTQLSFITGSGHQDFITTATKLSESLSAEQIREAIFGPWSYGDKSLSFRWDPADAAEYALAAGDPSAEGAWTVWGANRLAFAALPLYPVQPTKKGLATTGFREARPEEFSWPLWGAWLGADSVRSLVSYGELRADAPDRGALGAMGIVEVFRAPRVRIGQGANFKVSFRPARAV